MADEQPKEPEQNKGTPQSSESQRNRRRGRRYRRPRHENAGSAVGNTSDQQPQQGEGAPSQNIPNPQHQQRQHDPEVTIVVPVYNEEHSLRELYNGVRDSLRGRYYDVIFVDDGSTDGSYRVIRELKRTDPRHIRIVRFRRNYGKSAALSVGFEKARGRVVVTMDSDLQDDPAEIPNLLRKVGEGYDLVSGWKRVRRDPLSKTIPSRLFNFVTRILTGIKIHDFNCGLKAYRHEVIKTVNVYGELHRYVPVLAHWEGFSVGEIVVQHRARKYGKTKYGVTRFWRGLLDLLTVLFTTRYFRKPLHLFGFWGLASTVAGLVIDGYLVVLWFLGKTSLSNRPLFLGGIMLIIVGIQFISIGLLGEMISKTKQSDVQYSIREFIP